MSSCARAPTSTSPPPGATGFDASAWRDDYATLKRALELEYANATWFASTSSPVDLSKLDRETSDRLAKATNDVEARAAIDRFIRAFGDGHLDLLDDAPSTSSSGSARLPLATTAAVACGSLRFVGRATIPFSTPIESSAGYVALHDGVDEPFRSGVVALPSGRHIGVVRVPSFVERAYPSVCAAAWPEVSASIAHGSPARSECDDACEERLWRATTVKLLALFRARVTELGARKVDGVMLDLGQNGGGTDWADAVARALTSKPLHAPKVGLVRGEASARLIDETAADARTLLAASTALPDSARSALADADARARAMKALLIAPIDCDLSWIWRERRPWQVPAPACSNVAFGAMSMTGLSDFLATGSLGSDAAEEALFASAASSRAGAAWSGPLVVLMDENTASASEQAAAMLRDGGAATLVGRHTVGSGCGFMGPEIPIVLPRTGTRVRAPNCLRLRADGSDEVAGLMPDRRLDAKRDDPARRVAELLEALDASLPPPVTESRAR